MTVETLPLQRLSENRSSVAGFRSRAACDESPETIRHVRLAVRRAKAGDREALRFLYIRYSDNVYGYMCSILRDEHDAEDVTQHVFAKLMTVLGKYDDRGIPFSAWLLRLARNAAIDHIRRQRARPSDNLVPGHSARDQGDRASCLASALASLPPEQRSVVILHHVIGLTPSEIATRMGRTESSIYGLHHRGRRTLRRALTDLDAAPCTVRESRSPR